MIFDHCDYLISSEHFCTGALLLGLFAVYPGRCGAVEMHSSYRNLTYESSSGDDCFQEDEKVGDECSIGITLKQSKGKFIIASIDEDGGGERSGAIHVNDIILQIEGMYFNSNMTISILFHASSLVSHAIPK